MNDPGDIGQRIKKLRRNLGLSQAEFALRSGVSIGGICEIEKGKRSLTAKTILRVCQTFRIDPAWLLLGEKRQGKLPILAAEPGAEYDAKPDLIAIPVVNEVPAGYPGYPELEDEIRDFLYVPGIPRRCFGLVVRGESMLPELADQDIVVVDPSIKSIEKGKIGVFRVNGEATIKICMPLEEEKGYILQPRNPNFQPILIAGDTECTVIGKVIYKVVKCT